MRRTSYLVITKGKREKGVEHRVNENTGKHRRNRILLTIPSLEGVEIVGSTGRSRVPCSVNLILGWDIPHLVVVLSVLECEKIHGSACSHGGGGKRRGRLDQSDDKCRLDKLQSITEDVGEEEGVRSVIGLFSYIYTVSSERSLLTMILKEGWGMQNKILDL
jgi:hypothetical protein